MCMADPHKTAGILHMITTKAGNILTLTADRAAPPPPRGLEPRRFELIQLSHVFEAE
jgi:hypothetical protein